MAKYKKNQSPESVEVESVEVESVETTKVEIVKDHPFCGNPVGDVCDLPSQFAEQLIKEGFAVKAK